MPDARWLDRDALARHISVRVDAIARLQRAGRLLELANAPLRCEAADG